MYLFLCLCLSSGWSLEDDDQLSIMCLSVTCLWLFCLHQMIYVPLDTKLIISETFFPVSLLAWYWRFFHWVYQLQLWLITSVQSNLATAASPSHTHLCNVYSFTVGTCHILCLDNRKSRYHVMLQNRSLWHIDFQLSWIFEINLLTVVALARPIPHHLAEYSGHRWR